MEARRLLCLSLTFGLAGLFFAFIPQVHGAVRCASTRPTGVGFVFDEDVQLNALAANSPDALPGRRPADSYKSPRSYQGEERRPPAYNADRDVDYSRGRNPQYNDKDSRRHRPVLAESPRADEDYEWNAQRNGTGGVYPADGPRDRISRYPSRRNESSYGDEYDSYQPAVDEPYGRRRSMAQRRNESRGYPYEDLLSIPYGRPSRPAYSAEEPDEAAEDSRLIQLLIKREKERFLQRSNSTYEKPSRYDSPDNYAEKRRPAYESTASERYRERDDDDDDDETCPIETWETKSHQTDFPLTAVTAILSVPIGDFILYAAEAPGKAIITYNLNCDGPDARGNEPLYTATANSCFHLLTVDDLVEVDRPVPIIICLSHGAFSTAFRVDYDQNQFRLQPCLQIIEHKFITDVATVAAGKAGSLVAFSNNDLRPEAEYHETIAPIYLARDGQLILCGYVDVQHTTDVALWQVRSREFVVAYIEKRPGTRRSLIHFFEIIIKNNRCHSIRPKAQQAMLGGSSYAGQRNNLCASEPFTVDHAICGAEDIQFLTSHDKQYHPATHLAVAIANDAFEEGRIGCPDQELVCPDNAREKCFCACPNANHRSFVVEFNPRSGSFDLHSDQRRSFQELTAGPESVTEITHLPTEKCCMVFQTISPLGATELYTIENDGYGAMRVFQFYDSGLPHFAEKSSFGYCSANDLIISYTLHSFQTDNTIYHLQCNKDRRSEWKEKPYRGGYNDREEGRDEEYGDRDYRAGQSRYRGEDNSRTPYSTDRYVPTDDRLSQYGNVSNNYPLPRRGNYRVPPVDLNNRTLNYPRNAMADAYKYRPANLPPSQISATPYGRPRISAVLPDMDFGNHTFAGHYNNYPINGQGSQQYNRAGGGSGYPVYIQSNRTAPQQPPTAYPNNQAGYTHANRSQSSYRPPPYHPVPLPPPPPPSQPYGYHNNPMQQLYGGGPQQPPGGYNQENLVNNGGYRSQQQPQQPGAPPIGGWPVSYSSRYGHDME